VLPSSAVSMETSQRFAWPRNRMNRWLYSADAASAAMCEMDAQGAKMLGGRLGTCLALLVHQLILCM
jgi:hypothetical protein